MAHSFKWQSLLGLVVCLGGTALWASDSTSPVKLAEKAWEVTTVVLDNHVHPPTRRRCFGRCQGRLQTGRSEHASGLEQAPLGRGQRRTMESFPVRDLA